MTGILWAVATLPESLQPLYSNSQKPHVTLQYGVEQKDWYHLIGLPMTVGVLSHCYNDRVEALKVALPTWVECQNPHPHITLSWVDGSAPVESNAMLASEYKALPVDFDYAHTVIERLNGVNHPQKVGTIAPYNNVSIPGKQEKKGAQMPRID